ncbi:DUF4129 domain-containing protein [Pyrococcus yayanosii]|uniref:Protein-glutamine gamma-glutamyltransferase-like C-terminal domain-containing protein n=1 Tax=Pyrococcus yayanosii (strain CH1 / JCM 16557) TaxID=529709 RepID=F8AGK7_PYRYC|nr:DUF4129 domain-containing protein [Pyrococcus yayanosii]AEH23978.1 hypothetical protein PYCH_02810 [Pyrococcus yayanosii CH1]
MHQGKARLTATFFCLILLMAFLPSGTARIGTTRIEDLMTALAVLLLALYVFLTVFLVILLLSWRDISAKEEAYDGFLRRFLTMLAPLVASVILYFFVLPRLPAPLSNTSASQETILGPVEAPSIVPLRPVETRAGGEAGSYYAYGLAALGILAMGLALLTLVRELVKIGRKRAVKRSLQAFDSRLEEEGLDLFSNPRDAVIELYKKAVLWLEVLGNPYKESWTHWEHAARVSYRRQAYVTLAKLFEKAKYAPERITREDAKRAYELYMAIRGEENEIH